MRPERLYLNDIVESADAVARFVAGKTRESFEGDDLFRSAVLHKLMLIGEAAARLPAEFKTRHAEVPWADVVAFRNIAVHEYFAVDWIIVWNAATSDAPKLRQFVAAILEREFPVGT
jgi:uncharacterized protein with HEPN domain